MKTILSLKKSVIVITLAVCLPIVISSFNSRKLPSIVSSNRQVEAVITEVKVSIEDMAYVPASITVTKGTKVTWTNYQAVIPHTVTSDTKGLFDSGKMHKNDTFSYTFNDAGTFTYYCTHHKKMHGTVIVK